MKIVNETTGGLSISFDFPAGPGCGYIPPGGPPLVKHFNTSPTAVRITMASNEPIRYEGLGQEVTITVLSKVEGDD